jgi:hypothetical protein
LLAYKQQQIDEVIHFEGIITRDIHWRAQWLHSRRKSFWFLILSVGTLLLGALGLALDKSGSSGILGLTCGITVLLLLGVRKFRIRQMYDRSPQLHKDFRGTICRRNYYRNRAVVGDNPVVRICQRVSQRRHSFALPGSEHVSNTFGTFFSVGGRLAKSA